MFTQKMQHEMQHQVVPKLLPDSDTEKTMQTEFTRAFLTQPCTHTQLRCVKAKPTHFILSFSPANTPCVISLIFLDPSREDSLLFSQCLLPILLVITIMLYPAWEQGALICINHK